jgi:hypothetical protein
MDDATIEMLRIPNSDRHKFENPDEIEQQVKDDLRKMIADEAYRKSTVVETVKRFVVGGEEPSPYDAFRLGVLHMLSAFDKEVAQEVMRVCEAPIREAEASCNKE